MNNIMKTMPEVLWSAVEISHLQQFHVPNGITGGDSRLLHSNTSQTQTNELIF